MTGCSVNPVWRQISLIGPEAWLIGAQEAKVSMGALQLSPQTLAELIALIDDGTISGKIGKQLLPALLKVHLSCRP